MPLTRTKMHRALGAVTLLSAVAFIAAPEACAQQPSSSDQLNTLMTHRQELSTRAVEETKQRRFEDKKSDSTFPSDAANSRKGGVVRRDIQTPLSGWGSSATRLTSIR